MLRRNISCCINLLGSTSFHHHLLQQHRSFTSQGLDFLLNPTPEHTALRETLQKFAIQNVAPQAHEFNEVKKSFNFDLFKEVVDMGLIAMTVPEEDGGTGLDALAVTIASHELCKYDPAFVLSAFAHSILFINNFYYSATPAQRKKYLPDAISGKVIGGCALSEACAGTDLLGMKTHVKKDDATGDFILNGSKMWITNGPIGDLFIVYAQNLSEKTPKISSFLVEKGMKGFSQGPPIEKIGMSASPTGALYFDNVRIPAANLIGENPNGIVGMMRNLEIERVLLAAMSVGIADQCVDMMIKYANERKSFGKSLTNFGQIQRYIAESFAKTEAAKTLTYTVARTVTPGNQNRIGTDAAKLFAAPVGKEVADNCMQVMGGMGYSRDMPAERLWRDAKLVEIGGGTLESHHKNLTKDMSSIFK